MYRLFKQFFFTSGLQKRVRHMSPHSLYVNCRNHRLALCFTHLLKKNATLSDVEGVLVSIWKLFHFSAKRHAVFQQMQELYDEKPLTFIRAAATRYFKSQAANDMLLFNYNMLLSYYTQPFYLFYKSKHFLVTLIKLISGLYCDPT